MVMPSIWQNSKDFSGNVNAEMLDLAILISEQDDKNKKVLLLMDGTEISLRKVDNDLQVAINKERIVLPEGGSYEYQEDNMVIAEISKQNGMIMLISEMYELKVVYDGERIQLQVSRQGGARTTTHVQHSDDATYKFKRTCCSYPASTATTSAVFAVTTICDPTTTSSPLRTASWRSLRNSAPCTHSPNITARDPP